MFKPLTLVGLAAATLSAVSYAQAPSVEELWKVIQQQQAQIEALQQKLESTEQKVVTTEQKVEATANAVEQAETATAKVAKVADNTQLGGYVEGVYSNLDTQKRIDMQRFVLYVGHDFQDDLRFYSEVEIEHAGVEADGDPLNGEVEIEQAFIEWDYMAEHRAKAGVFLVPVGIINETHEPNTFYGVQRNLVERNIIPATWWEGGVDFSGAITPGWSYDFAAHSGLELANGSASVRNARQKASQANAQNLAYTGRVKYTGLAGLEWAASTQYQTDVTQDDANGNGINDASGILLETHIAYQTGPWGVRALYAQWDIDDEIETITAGSDEQDGWYLEPSYKFTEKLGVFTRYSQFDQRGGDNLGSEQRQYDLGFNYWIHPDVVFKADVQHQDRAATTVDADGFNLGVGWVF